MKKLTLIFAVILFAGTLFAQQTRGFVKVRQSKKDHIALVIGNSAYPDMPLTNPKNDAEAVAQAFEDMGFVVIKVIDADKEQMAMAIDDFSKKIVNANAAVFYYAGHGMQVDGANYLIPIGRTTSQQISKAEQVPYRAVNAGEVLTAMENAKVNFSLVVLDACRNNPIGGNRGKLKGLASIDAPAGSLVMYSTKAGDVASDGNGKNSPFTTAFLQHITTPGLDVNLLPSRITQTVRELTGNQQTPGSYVQITQSFTFVPAYTDQELEELKNQLSDLEYREKELQRQQNSEDAEIAKKQAEIEKINKQIADLNNNGSSGNLDKKIELIKQRKNRKEQLDSLTQIAEIESKKREEKMQQIKLEKYNETIEKYYKIANSEYGQDLKDDAWNDVLVELNLAKNSILIGDENTLKTKYFKNKKITFNSDPQGALVIIDGQDIEQTPFQTMVNFGKHDITLKKNNYFDFSNKINITYNGQSDYDFRLKPSEYTLWQTKYNQAISQKKISTILFLGGLGLGITNWYFTNRLYKNDYLNTTSPTQAEELHQKIHNKDVFTVVLFSLSATMYIPIRHFEKKKRYYKNKINDF